MAARAAVAASVAVVKLPTGWPDAWDVADAPPDGVTPDTLRAMLAAAEAEAQPEAAPGDALRADVARAAAMAREDYLASRLGLARKHRVRVRPSRQRRATVTHLLCRDLDPFGDALPMQVVGATQPERATVSGQWPV